MDHESRLPAPGGRQTRSAPVVDLRFVALAVGLITAFWVHAIAFGRADDDVYRDVRWPYVAAGLAAMAMANARPLRWMIVAVATATPTALTGCYFIGMELARGEPIPWVHVRIAATMLLATAIGAVTGRVSGGVRRGV